MTRSRFVVSLIVSFICLTPLFAPAATQRPMVESVRPGDTVVLQPTPTADAATTLRDEATTGKSVVTIVSEGFEAGFPSTWSVLFGNDVEAWWDLSSYRAASGSYSTYCAAGGSASG